MLAGFEQISGFSSEGDMSESKLLRLSRHCNNAFTGALQNKEYLAFVCQGFQIGLLSPKVIAEILPKYSNVFHKTSLKSSDVVELHPELNTFQKRTDALDQILREMRTETDFLGLKGWREECYDIKLKFHQNSIFRMERSATSIFGLRQYGVDINGYISHPEKGLCLWMQRRSKTKQTWPGKMDNFVGGGLGSGIDISENVRKEAMEEANVDEELAKEIVPAGSVSFFFESERGLFPNTEFVFDLELPIDFRPKNNDGEVEDFQLLTVAEVLQLLTTSDMKTTSAPVTLDFLIRKGIINAENEPGLPELVENLHLPLHHLYKSYE